MANKEIPYKIYLEENEMPRQWYNVRADMKNKPAPLLNPGTLKPMTAEELQKFFPEKEHRIRMYDAMEELKVSYQALVDQKADEKITKYIRL